MDGHVQQNMRKTSSTNRYSLRQPLSDCTNFTKPKLYSRTSKNNMPRRKTSRNNRNNGDRAETKNTANRTHNNGIKELKVLLTPISEIDSDCVSNIKELTVLLTCRNDVEGIKTTSNVNKCIKATNQKDESLKKTITRGLSLVIDKTSVEKNGLIQEKSPSNESVPDITTPIMNKVTFDLDKHNVKAITPLYKRLRHGEKKNYLELSNNSLTERSSLIKDIPKEKVPIYKQFSQQKQKEKLDPYELDISDSEVKKTIKSRRKNVSEKFDKTMYDVIQKLEKQQNKRMRRKKLKTSPQKYVDNIKSVMNRVMKKVETKKKKVETTCSREPLGTGQQNNINAGQHDGKSVQYVGKSVQYDGKSVQCDGKSVVNISVPKIHQNQQDSILINERLENQYQLKSFSRSSSALSFIDDRSRSPIVFDNYDSDDMCFGFNDDNENENPNNVHRINIISNTLITQKNKLITQRFHRNSCQSPWRFHASKKSNYLLSYKENSLPCLQQEPVLHFDFIERIEESFSKERTELKSLQKTHMQSSILEYINSSVDHSNKDNTSEIISRPTLYDYDEFEFSTTHLVQKKQILGENQERNVDKIGFISTPIRTNTIMPSPNISIIRHHTPKKPEKSILQGKNITCFGFNTEIEEQENWSVKSKPFRISFNTVKNMKKGTNSDGIIPVQDSASDKLPSVLQNDDKDISHDVQIFDDVEPELLTNIDVVSVILLINIVYCGICFSVDFQMYASWKIHFS